MVTTMPDRFWDKVSIHGEQECWPWRASIDSRGYGNFRVGDHNERAHRVAYTLTFGAIPEGGGHHGTVVMHTCDNRLCCNPAHLVLGSHADNMADMKEKGRRKAVNSGSANGRAKLTAEQVAAIRADTRGKRTIAPDYGISPAQVQRIRNGEQWT